MPEDVRWTTNGPRGRKGKIVSLYAGFVHTCPQALTGERPRVYTLAELGYGTVLQEIQTGVECGRPRLVAVLERKEAESGKGTRAFPLLILHKKRKTAMLVY